MLTTVLKISRGALPNEFRDLIENSSVLDPYLIEDIDQILGEKAIECAGYMIKQGQYKLVDKITTLFSFRNLP